MENNCVIGGEFAIDIQGIQSLKVKEELLEDTFRYSSGRSALYYILLDIQKKYGITTVYLPDYLCSSVVISAEKSQMSIEFYPLNDQLEIDKSKFPIQRNVKAAILLINYFGLKNLSQQVSFIRSISKQIVVIEDDVQAFYEFYKSDLIAEYKFTSLRKSFACPDGGLVKTKQLLPEISASNKFHQYKIAGSILKFLRESAYYDDEIFLHLFDKGEQQIDGEIATGMSSISQEIITKLDIQRIASIRQRNAKQILLGLRELGVKTILPVSDTSIPLFIPIWLENRNRVRKQMFQNQIFCPVHWPLEGLNVQKGAEMADHEMSIIVDQRYTENDMDFILTTLEKALK